MRAVGVKAICTDGRDGVADGVQAWPRRRDVPVWRVTDNWIHESPATPAESSATLVGLARPVIAFSGEEPTDDLLEPGCPACGDPGADSSALPAESSAGRSLGEYDGASIDRLLGALAGCVVTTAKAKKVLVGLQVEPADLFADLGDGKQPKLTAFLDKRLARAL